MLKPASCAPKRCCTVRRPETYARRETRTGRRKGGSGRTLRTLKFRASALGDPCSTHQPQRFFRGPHAGDPKNCAIEPRPRLVNSIDVGAATHSYVPGEKLWRRPRRAIGCRGELSAKWDLILRTATLMIGDGEINPSHGNSHAPSPHTHTSKRKLPMRRNS